MATRYEFSVVLRGLMDWAIVTAESRRRYLSQLRAKNQPQLPPQPTPAPRPRPVPGLPFADVPEQHWAREAVVALHSDWGIGKSILTGYADGTFAGNQALPRYEFALALQRAFESVRAIISQGEHAGQPFARAHQMEGGRQALGVRRYRHIGESATPLRFTVAYQQGKASDLATYLAENADWLGILKRHRKPKIPTPNLLTNPSGA